MKKLGSNSPCASIKSSHALVKGDQTPKMGMGCKSTLFISSKDENFFGPVHQVPQSILLSYLGQRRSNPKNGSGLLRMWHHMTTRQVCPFQYHSLIYIKICHKNKIFNEYFYKLINFNYFIFKFHIIDY